MSALEREISARSAGQEQRGPPGPRSTRRWRRGTTSAPNSCSPTPSRGSRQSRQLLTQIASVFIMDRKPLNAAIALKKAEALGPLDNHARLQLALAYIAMKRGDWARPELERLAKDEPDNVIHAVLAGPAGLRCRPVRVGDSPAAGRRGPGAGVRPRARQPGPLLRSAQSAGRGDPALPRGGAAQPPGRQGALGLAGAQSRHPAPHARGTGRGRNAVSRGVDLRSALRARLLSARRAPGADAVAWTTR